MDRAAPPPAEFERKLRSKRDLIRRAAARFVKKHPYVELDDAIQIFTLTAWQTLQRPDVPADKVDASIVHTGWWRVLDEVRAGHVTGIRRRGREAHDDQFPLSLNRVAHVDRQQVIEFIDTLPDQDSGYEAAELQADLDWAMAQLPERERFVIWAYNFADLTLAQIGELLGVTESRVSQIMTKAHARMRPLLHVA
jgi:RNA polymerase sigma factor (sigma-70 family)